MNLKCIKNIEKSKHDGLVYFVNEFKSNDDIDSLAIPSDLKTMLKSKYASEVFMGKEKQLIKLENILEETVISNYFLGLGNSTVVKSNTLRETVATLMSSLNKEKISAPAFILSYANLSGHMHKVIAETSLIANYTFDKYKESKKPSSIKEITFETTFNDEINEGKLLAKATNITKDLVNEPANILTPAEMAKRVSDYANEYNFDVDIFEEDHILENNMIAYHNVAKASANKAKLIIMKHMGNPDEPENIVGLVGKGLTFDTGGYSLKPGNSMLTMKSDMGGAGAVIGAMCAIAKSNLKINIYAVVAACENMIDSNGYRPGDIIGSMAGKSIYIKSTDAEGRLTLIDAITYSIRNLKIKKVIDIATLTGSQIHALGSNVSGVLSNNDELFASLQYGSDMSDELIWRMPTFDVYKKLIEHKEADLTNATKEAGMIGAGMFIGEFVEGLPWIHIDIAGPSYGESASGYKTFGASGVGARSLYYLAKDLAK